MKYFILILVASVQLSCATQNSSANEDSSMKDLIKKNQPVYIENQTIDEAIDFTTFVNPHKISEGVYQVTINSGVTFKNCVFKKPVNAFKKLENGNIIFTSFHGNVSFIDCIFMESVNFRGCSIYGKTNFSDSTFNVDVNFEELIYHENALFNRCKFEGSLRFQNSFFNQKANFMNAHFFDTVSFQNSVFNSEFQCGATLFYKYADFTLIDCRGKALFNYAEYREKADLSHSVFAQDFDFVSTKNNTTSFNNCRFFGSARFNKTEVITSLSFKNSYFLLDTPVIDVSSKKLISLN